jgi:Ankyrin repeats (many copies)
MKKKHPALEEHVLAMKDETDILKLCHWTLYGTHDKLLECIKTVDARLCNGSSVYLSALDLGNVEEILKDFMKAQSALCGEWHLNLVKAAYSEWTGSNLWVRWDLDGTLVGPNVMRLRGVKAIQVRSLKLLFAKFKGRTSNQQMIKHRLTPLVIAICRGNLDVCKTLVTHGAVVGTDELLLCIKTGNLALFKVLVCLYGVKEPRGVKRLIQWVKEKVRTNVKTKANETESTLNDEDISDRDETKGEELTVKEQTKLTKVLNLSHIRRPILNFAIHWNNPELVHYIFTNYHYPPKSAKKNSASFVHPLIQCSSESIIKLVFDRNPHLATIRILISCCSTALHVACQYMRFDIAKLLIDRYNADPNQADREGRTALHHCIHYISRNSKGLCPPKSFTTKFDQYVPIILLLIRRGANLNKPDVRGRTILYYLISAWSGCGQLSGWLNRLVQYISTNQEH